LSQTLPEIADQELAEDQSPEFGLSATNPTLGPSPICPDQMIKG
jgi:hypothetical protein